MIDASLVNETKFYCACCGRDIRKEDLLDPHDYVCPDDGYNLISTRGLTPGKQLTLWADAPEGPEHPDHENDFHRVRWNIRGLIVSKIHLTESADSLVALCGVGVPPPIMRIEPHGTTSNCMGCEDKGEKLVTERNREIEDED